MNQLKIVVWNRIFSPLNIKTAAIINKENSIKQSPMKAKICQFNSQMRVNFGKFSIFIKYQAQ